MTTRQPCNGLCEWFGNLFRAIYTVFRAMWVALKVWVTSYNPSRKTFTEHYEYPETPARVEPRFRGFHRFDLTACIACERCARECPTGCIHIQKQTAEGRKGFQTTQFEIDYGQCLMCGICTENCPGECLRMGSCYDLSTYGRDGCVVDFARIPVEIAWSQTSLSPTVVALSKQVDAPVYPVSEPQEETAEEVAVH